MLHHILRPYWFIRPVLGPSSQASTLHPGLDPGPPPNPTPPPSPYAIAQQVRSRQPHPHRPIARCAQCSDAPTHHNTLTPASLATRPPSPTYFRADDHSPPFPSITSPSPNGSHGPSFASNNTVPLSRQRKLCHCPAGTFTIFPPGLMSIVSISTPLSSYRYSSKWPRRQITVSEEPKCR